MLATGLTLLWNGGIALAVDGAVQEGAQAATPFHLVCAPPPTAAGMSLATESTATTQQ